MEPVNAHSAGSFVGQFGLSHCQLFPAAAKRAERGAVIGTAMRRPPQSASDILVRLWTCCSVF